MANIVVTGASKGIGFETVLELVVKNEHRILALSRSEKGLYQLSQIAAQLNPESILKTLVFDLSADPYQKLDPFITEFFSGRIDILINNAGQLVRKPFLETKISNFKAIFDVNFFAPIQLIQYLFPYMKQEKSHIVNIGSMGGYFGSNKFIGLSAYSSSKGALHTLTECLSEEFKEMNISVNALALGAVQTEMLEEAFGGFTAPVLAFEMGAYIADFAINGHRYFNGKIIPVALNNPS